MRLGTKLTLAFALVALVPIALVATVARTVYSNQYRAELKARSDAAEAALSADLRRAAEEVAQIASRMARPEYPFIHGLLVDMARGELDDERERSLSEDLALEMKSQGLDALEILDRHGTVLGSAHFVGKAGEDEHQRMQWARSAVTETLARPVNERVMENGRAQNRWIFMAARVVRAKFEDREAQLVVIAGRRVDRLLTRLPDSLRLSGVGQNDAQDFGPRRQPPFQKRLVKLSGVDGEEVLSVEIVIPDEEADRIFWINLTGAALGIGGLLLAILVGGMVARRITKPLDVLGEGARRVARGDLGTSVDIHDKDEIGELAGAFNRMTRDLKDAQDALIRAERVSAFAEVARHIAHEIKNPLTPIQMAMENLQRARQKAPEKFDSLFDESAHAVLEEVARLRNIVQSFNEFGRMPASHQEQLDLAEVVRAAAALYPGVVTVDVDASASVSADRDQMRQVLANLLENAREAVVGKSDGCVTLTIKRSEARIEVLVSDNGVGMDATQRGKLFTPYFTTKTKGTGLGLCIVQRIVFDHQGHIHVESAPGQGTTFVIALPSMK